MPIRAGWDGAGHDERRISVLVVPNNLGPWRHPNGTALGEQVTMRRVVVVGCSGAGKSTLATRIADVLGAPHIELDALHWGPDWTPVDPPDY